MKKNNLFLAWLLTAVIATLGLSSCSNELADEPKREEMVDVVVSTSLPETLQTYGSNSQNGGLANLETLEGSLYVRYIMEIYTESGTLVKRLLINKKMISGSDYRSATFSLRLFAATYNIVLWADIAKKVSSSLPEYLNGSGLSSERLVSPYFISNSGVYSDVLVRPVSASEWKEGNLKVIKASVIQVDEGDASNIQELYDAYSCTQTITLTNENTTYSDFTLTRPFAKVRVITTDKGETERTCEHSLTITRIGMNSGINTTFNALTGKYSGASSGNGYWETQPHSIGSYNNESGPDRTLCVFYLPVSQTADAETAHNLNFYFDIYDTNGNVLGENIHLNVSNVPLVGNHLTTIRGKVLTGSNRIEVNIEDEFVSPPYEVNIPDGGTGSN